ncbi:Bax inhibitor-1/YccA family protein [Phytomonospora endophytica]|uniref:Putative YccA/Bax inhibitor family protein n=1 Tax=Phytomonospora endophytica TaxID=714109 RepID=A0A841FKU0_9ACTN|nr:Bax inhibitor-1/YccA family protein [Phytomonospora endophytica]MBB6036505.1 putative YccA/Bax inhibitor family protein [Phytomonospora endophytica]GIG65827.1 membrane protein [Phytomonospora endophytica]
MRSSNPALNRWVQGSRQQAPAPEYGHMVNAPRVTPMTLDDVVIRTIGLIALTGIAGAVAWNMWTIAPKVAPVLIAVGSIVGLAVILASWFTTITNPAVIITYAVAQGLMLGAVSAVFENRFPGIVIQAVMGTFGVFATMALLYKSRVIRATPRFKKITIGAVLGIMALSFINFVLYLFGANMGLEVYDLNEKAGLIAIGFTVVCIIVAAMTFVLDFDMVEMGVRTGAPKKYAWAAAFGMLAGLIFLYWQILKLLSYLRR